MPGDGGAEGDEGNGDAGNQDAVFQIALVDIGLDAQFRDQHHGHHQQVGHESQAGNVEGLAMLAFGAGVGKPISAPDILKPPVPELPEVPGLIKAYDALDTAQGASGGRLGRRKDPGPVCKGE